MFALPARIGFADRVTEKRDKLGYPIGRGRDDLDMGGFLNVRLIRTSAKLALLFQRQALRPNGLNQQDWRVLINIAKLGDCHLRELGRTATIDPSHVSRATKALEARGLIRRYPDPDDKRRTRMTLTTTGTRMVDRIWPMALELNDRIEAVIGDTSMDALCQALDRTRGFVEQQLDLDTPDPDSG